MEGAEAAPRSPRTLKRALVAVDDLESAGLLLPSEAVGQRDALKSEGEGAEAAQPRRRMRRTSTRPLMALPKVPTTRRRS